MAVKGGYRIIDLHGMELSTSAPVTVPGVYEKIESSYGKPLLFSGINYGGMPRNDCFVAMAVDSGNYTGIIASSAAATYRITIASNDTITFTETAAAAG